MIFHSGKRTSLHQAVILVDMLCCFSKSFHRLSWQLTVISISLCPETWCQLWPNANKASSTLRCQALQLMHTWLSSVVLRSCVHSKCQSSNMSCHFCNAMALKMTIGSDHSWCPVQQSHSPSWWFTPISWVKFLLLATCKMCPIQAESEIVTLECQPWAVLMLVWCACHLFFASWTCSGRLGLCWEVRSQFIHAIELGIIR